MALRGRFSILQQSGYRRDRDHIPIWLLRTDRPTTELRWNFLFRRAGVYRASEDWGGEYFVGAVVS